MTGGELEPWVQPPAIGEWAVDVRPAAHSKEARTIELDALVVELKGAPGMWRLIDVCPGRGGGPSSSLRGRGCNVKTRHRRETGETEVWASWPVPREVPGNPGGRSSG